MFLQTNLSRALSLGRSLTWNMQLISPLMAIIYCRNQRRTPIYEAPRLGPGKSWWLREIPRCTKEQLKTSQPLPLWCTRWCGMIHDFSLGCRFSGGTLTTHPESRSFCISASYTWAFSVSLLKFFSVFLLWNKTDSLVPLKGGPSISCTKEWSSVTPDAINFYKLWSGLQHTCIHSCLILFWSVQCHPKTS